jgi:hypothetical protein
MNSMILHELFFEGLGDPSEPGRQSTSPRREDLVLNRNHQQLGRRRNDYSTT